MKKSKAVESEVPQNEVHFMRKQRTLVSNKLVDYNNLTSFEAASMAAVFVLAVFVGVATTAVA